MNSEIKLRFGKYKGMMIKNVPDSYLKWCIDKKVLVGKALLYAKQKLNYPKDKYKVEVENAVMGDGTYFIDAHSKDDAIVKVKIKYKIQITQSFYGTSFNVIKLKQI